MYDCRMKIDKYLDEADLSKLYPSHIQCIKSRFDRALNKAGAGHAVIFSGAPQRVFLDDYHYPFKPNPHFVSWLPLTTLPFCYLVYSADEMPVLIYFQEKDYWHKAPANPRGYWTAYFDIRIVHSLDEVAEHLPRERDKSILIGEVTDPAHAFGIDRVNPNSALNILHYARAIKTGYELDCMRAASRRAVKGHRAAEKAFRKGRSEFDIHLDYCRAVEQADIELPYGNIVALNENGAVLHYQYQSREKPTESRSFLIDAGASTLGYAADITRTYAKEDGRFADLVERFDKLQLELVAEVRAGVNFADLHLLCHRKVAEVLNEFKLTSGSAEALIDAGVTSAFYPHGLGHLLGLQVHDMGGHMCDESGAVTPPPEGHAFLRLTRDLEVDQVLTIEPGLYVIDMLQTKLADTPGGKMVNQKHLDWLRPYGGIRIEDNVRVMRDGCENLTRDAFSK